MNKLLWQRQWQWLPWREGPGKLKASWESACPSVPSALWVMWLYYQSDTNQPQSRGKQPFPSLSCTALVSLHGQTSRTQDKEQTQQEKDSPVIIRPTCQQVVAAQGNMEMKGREGQGGRTEREGGNRAWLCKACQLPHYAPSCFISLQSFLILQSKKS